MRVRFPSLLDIDLQVAGNRVQRLIIPEADHECKVGKVDERRIVLKCANGVEVLVIPPGAGVLKAYSHVIRAFVRHGKIHQSLTSGIWIKHPRQSSAATAVLAKETEITLKSWTRAFQYHEESPETNTVGLRRPQLGALHAIAAHWTVSNEPATIVMPTGTGKTEVMLSLLVSTPCPKLLVVVPTDALRTQLAKKFMTLGILKAAGSKLLSDEARLPICCTLERIPKTVEEVDQVFGSAHVIIATSNVVGRPSEEIQARIAQHCPYLFVDEAHHTEAPTWRNFKEHFTKSRVLQFTATPFREDGKALDGKIIYKYPLKQAQADGYFKPITFYRVNEFNSKRADGAIAKAAIQRLREEKDKGHILMARVNSIARAAEVLEYYKGETDLLPIELHTGITSKTERDERREQIISGRSRIVVCVDMLGEGFDLPELKIAAFHDIRKSLSVTLQLAGRFTRTRPDLGNATFIANTADVNVQEELRQLYSREPDWNALLPELSERMIGEEQSLQDFMEGFSESLPEVPLRHLRPATSLVAYRTDCSEWSPEHFGKGLRGFTSATRVVHFTNHAEHMLVIITGRRTQLPWLVVEEVYNWQWDLYVVIWSPQQGLLYINSSDNSEHYLRLAQAVCGSSVVLIRGQVVFRALHRANRLRLQNVGLTEQLGRSIRYTGRMGSNVGSGMSDLVRATGTKTVVAGSCFLDGERDSIGASTKGRIWSHRRPRLDQLTLWCKQIGDKLLDDSIDPEEVLKGTLTTRPIKKRPKAMPVGIDWPEDIYKEIESHWIISINGVDYSISDVGIELVTPALSGPLTFALATESQRVLLQLELLEQNDSPDFKVVVQDGIDAEIRSGQSGTSRPVSDFFNEAPPVFWFADGASLEGCELVELRDPGPPLADGKLVPWDWAGTNIRRESQGPQRDPNTVQAKVIAELEKRGGYEVIVDDDGSGEAADVVAIRVTGGITAPTGLVVEFYHCKYSHGPAPGARIDDLYEVCGQAQKSVNWLYSPVKARDLFTHLLRRNDQRLEGHSLGRIVVGDKDLLEEIREISSLFRMSLKIFIVQPGVSKAALSTEQRSLLSVTDNYLTQTYQVPFAAIVSP